MLSLGASCVAIFAAVLTFLPLVRHYGLFGGIAPSGTKGAQKEITFTCRPQFQWPLDPSAPA
jgi:hypothetical protein